MPSVAFVSNRPRETDVSEQIDACDEVVRFSACEGYGKTTGSKATIWVTRTDRSIRGPGVLAANKEVLDQVLPKIHTAYILHGFYNHERAQMRYDISNLCTQYPFMFARSRPLDAGPVAVIHPQGHPTAGLVFLQHVLLHDVFPGWMRHLVGFAFDREVGTGVPGSHHPLWEKAIVDGWVEQGLFTQID